MRICILANALAVHTQRWAMAYAAAGHDVSVLSIREHRIPGVKTETVCVGPTNSRSVFWTFLSYVRLLLTCRRRLKAIAPDVVHAHYAVTHGVIGAFSGFHPFAISVWGKDVIWDGPGQMPWYLRRSLRYAFARADLICSTSKFMRDEIEHLVPDAKSIEVIPFGVDCEVFRPSAEPRENGARPRFRIGFVKTLAKKYGPRVLLRAMPGVLQEVPYAQLVMAGCGPLEQELKVLARELGIEDHVEFVGFVPHADVPALMQTFDVLVNSSVYDSESFGVVVLEAAACGVPAVATDVGGVSEVCLDGQTGLLVEPRNPKAIAEALVKLANDDGLRRRMSAAGRAFVQQNYRWSQNVTQMLTCLHDVASMDSKGAKDDESSDDAAQSPVLANSSSTSMNLSGQGLSHGR